MRLSTAYATVVVSVIFATATILVFLGILAVFDPAYGKRPVKVQNPKLDPKVYLDHLRRFGENRYMSLNELRRAMLVETQPGDTEPLLSDKIISLASWYNEKRFLYEMVEDTNKTKEVKRVERFDYEALKQARKDAQVLLSRLQGVEGQYRLLLDDRDHWRGRAMKAEAEIKRLQTK